MKPTATQILQRCKDIVEGNYPENGREVYQAGAIFTITYNLFSVDIQEGSGDSSFERAAFLLGMDSESEPVPEIVLEWVEDELKYESVAHHAYYNGLIECYISASKDEKARFAWISVNRSRVANMPEKYQHVKTAHEARAWCVEQITKIITPTPKP